MKGQAFISAIYVLPVIIITILITFWVYGSVSGIVPHDQLIRNETLCATCVLQTNYAFDNLPVLNDSTMACYNNSGATTITGRGSDVPANCLGYNINGNTNLNLTNGTSAVCSFVNVICDYTFDEANANEQSFWTTSTSNINSGYTLGSVVPIIFAAVIIITVVFLIGRQG